MRLTIEGMSCNHCKMRVEKSLKALEGVKSVEVDLGTGVATISTSKEIEDRLLKEAVEDAGYLLKGIER